MHRPEKFFWFAAAAGLAVAVSPFALEAVTGEFQRWFPLLLVGGVLTTIVFGSIALALRIQGRAREKLFSGEALLVRWVYESGEWQHFVAAENAHLDKVSRGPLYVVFAMLAAGIVVGFMLGRTTGIIVASVLGTILVGSIILMLFAPRIRGHALSPSPGRPPEVRIGTSGLLRCREFHRWSGWEAALEDVGLIAPNGEGPAHLVFTYSYASGNSRMTTTVRVPVPSGREEEAASLVARLQAPCQPPPVPGSC